MHAHPIAIFLSGLLVFSGYLGLNPMFETTSASVNEPVGTVSGSLFAAHPDGVGTESFTLTFASITGSGVLDLDGYTVSDRDNFAYQYSGVSLSHNESVRICADMAQDPKCDIEWSGGEVFDDAGDSLTLTDRAGVTVLTINYSNAQEGVPVRGNGEVSITVLENKDKITICHEDEAGLELSAVPVAAFTNKLDKDQKQAHHTHPNDIIPGFYYFDQKQVQYYGGKNWPEQADVLEQGC